MADDTNSILDSVKLILDIEPDETAFDGVIIIHINSVFSTLNQLGVGLPTGFEISDKTTTWNDYLDGDLRLSNVKSYVSLRVRLLFDPPPTSFGITAVSDQIKELEWRLMVTVDPPTPSKNQEVSIDVWND